MNLNFSQFKKVGEDEKSATLKHFRGHEIKIAKSALSPKLREQLSGLPLHYDEGGVVPDTQAAPQQAPINLTINTGQPSEPQAPLSQRVGQHVGNAVRESVQDTGEAFGRVASPFVNAGKGLLQGFQGQDAAPQMPAMAPEIAQPAAMQEQSPSPSVSAPPAAPVPSMFPTKGLEQQQAGIYGEAKALGEQGKAQADIYQQNTNALMDLQKRHDAAYQDIDKEVSNAQADLRNSHIDPNRLVNNMSFMQKVSTGIGLILGGFAGGVTHQENPVLQGLHQQIENDVKSQVKDMDKKETLVGILMKKYGNLEVSTNMARAIQANMVLNQVQQAAATSQDPLAKARAMEAAGPIQMQIDAYKRQAAMSQAISQSQGGGSPAVNPSLGIRFLVPEHQQAAAFKELGEAQELLKARDVAMGVFDQLNKTNTVTNRAGSPVQSSKQVEATLEPTVLKLARDAAGRVNEYELPGIRAMFPRPGDSAETIGVKKRNLLNFVQQKIHTPTLDAFGLSAGKVTNPGAKTITLGPPKL